jgi:hypothetical protein
MVRVGWGRQRPRCWISGANLCDRSFPRNPTPHASRRPPKHGIRQHPFTPVLTAQIRGQARLGDIVVKPDGSCRRPQKRGHATPTRTAATAPSPPPPSQPRQAPRGDRVVDWYLSATADLCSPTSPRPRVWCMGRGYARASATISIDRVVQKQWSNTERSRDECRTRRRRRTRRRSAGATALSSARRPPAPPAPPPSPLRGLFAARLEGGSTPRFEAL